MPYARKFSCLGIKIGASTEGEFYVKAQFYPFLRTLETMVTEVQAYLYAADEYKGAREARRRKVLGRLREKSPKTWRVLNQMDSVNHRIVKKRIFQQSRLDWGRYNFDQRVWPTLSDNPDRDNTAFLEKLREELASDAELRSRVGAKRLPDLGPGAPDRVPVGVPDDPFI